jgi:hypothetical protein
VLDKTYVYVFVRKDLPLTDQMVQASHAALEAGIAFGAKSKEPSSLIMLAVKDKESLIEAEEHCLHAGIDTEMFFEPDWNYGFTAFATEPITQDKRHLLKGFPLWKP